MAEFLAFSDAHFHEFRAYSVPTPYTLGGQEIHIGSRLHDNVKAYRRMLSYARENGIKTILFGGDLFHVKNSYSKVTFEVVHSLLKEAKDLQIYMIAGNHDFSDKKGRVSGLLPFSDLPHVHYLQGVGCVQIDDFQLLHIPFSYTKEQYVEYLEALDKHILDPSLPTVLLSHIGIQGARVGSDYVLVADSDISCDQIPTSVDLCLFGHFHEFQQLTSNSFYIGALTQHSWGDANGTRGFLHVEVGKGQVDVTHIESNSPKFASSHIDDLSLEGVRNGDFLRVYVDDARNVRRVKREVQELLDKQNLQLGALEVHVKQVKVTIDDTPIAPAQFSLDKVLEVWVDKNDPKHKTDTLALGKQLLKKAREGLV